MSFLMSLSDLIDVTGGQLINGDYSFTQLSTDSRAVVAGDVFLALSGENFDGHQFCQQAIDNGAIALVVERELAIDVPQLVVSSAHLALGKIAQYNRQQYKGPVIAVTGSNGKTTTKELIASILAQKGNTLATLGNLNNEIGVPLTLLRLNEDHQYSVVEMGANGKGEIAYCTALAAPDVAVITNAMGAHLEGFGSLQGVVEAKAEIFAGLVGSGTAVVNLDDANVEQWLSMLAAKKVTTFSLKNALASVFASDLKQLAAGNYQFTLNIREEEQLICQHVTLQLLAVHNVKNALAAAACCFAIGCSIENIAAGLECAQAINGRLKQLQGCNGATIIDDSYNGNPDSVKAGIDLLAQLPGKKVLLLGDMAELGDDELMLHREIGSYAAAKNIDYVMSSGSKGALAANEFALVTKTPAFALENKKIVIQTVKEMMNSETKILIKGSLSAGMGEVVNALKVANDSELNSLSNGDNT